MPNSCSGSNKVIHIAPIAPQGEVYKALTLSYPQVIHKLSTGYPHKN